MDISVVIIAKNEAAGIEKCVASALLIATEVIVADTGSTDNTIELARNKGAKVVQTLWQGFGLTKNYCASIATNNWIFSLDADEEVTAALAAEIAKLKTAGENCLFKTKRTGFFRNKKIRFGAWANEYVIRLYNKQFTGWDVNEVHEKIIKHDARVVALKGVIHHYTVKNLSSFTGKNLQYAYLWANNAAKNNKKSPVIKQFIAPLFNFLQGYILKLGFLDGIEGYWIAKVSAYYTFMKYAVLNDIYKGQKPVTPGSPDLPQ